MMMMMMMMNSLIYLKYELDHADFYEEILNNDIWEYTLKYRQNHGLQEVQDVNGTTGLTCSCVCVCIKFNIYSLSENKVHRQIFQPRRNESRKFKILHSEMFPYLYELESRSGHGSLPRVVSCIGRGLSLGSSSHPWRTTECRTE